MTHTTDRARRATAVGLAGALTLSPLAAAMAGDTAAGDGAQLRLAQSASSSSKKTTAGPGETSGASSTNAPAPGAAAGAAPPGAGAGGIARNEVERQISELHKQLRITPAQEPQFKAFADIMRGNADQMDAIERQEGPHGASNAVDDMRLYQKLTESEAEGLRRQLPAFQALYDSLSDQQKRTADSVMGRNAQGGGAPPAGGGGAPPRGRPPG